MKKVIAIYQRDSLAIKDGKFVTESRNEEVRVMASAEGYAMVRIKGCLPFVVDEKKLIYR